MQWQLVCLLAPMFLGGLMAMPSDGLILKRASKCNGYQELCDRKYSNITYIGAHDSYAVGDNYNDVAANQVTNVTSQLNDGIRLLQIQGHNSSKGATNDNPSGISLCHTSCALMNGGTLESYLGDVASFLKNNPNEVITIIIANVENIAASEWDKGFKKAGLNDMAYTTSQESIAKDDWPTLQNMINKNQRLVVLIDNQADLDSANYILPEFSNVWENPYDQTSSNFNCTPDRYDGDTEQMMYLINHFLDKNKEILGANIKSPDVNALNDTNSVDAIMKDASQCASDMNYYPTFVLVDFYTAGDGTVFEAAAEMNGVNYVDKPLSKPSSESQDSSAQVYTAPTLAMCMAVLFATVLTWM